MSEVLNVVCIFVLNFLVDYVRRTFSLFLWLMYYYL